MEPRKRAGVDRRQEILLAARSAFVENGIHATPMRMIARAIGVTEGALYRHFASKEDMVTALFQSEGSAFHDWLERRLDSWRERVSGRGAGANGEWEELEILVRAFLDYGREESESFRVMMVLHQSPGVAARPMQKLPRRLFEAALLRLGARRGRPVPDLTAVVVMIAGLLSRLVDAERAGQISLDRGEVSELAVRATRGLVNSVLDG